MSPASAALTASNRARSCPLLFTLWKEICTTTGDSINATNVAIVAPLNASDINTLPARSLDGRVNTTGATLQLTSTPVKNLNLSARWRYYDFDNRTARITFPGYVRFDAVWQSIGRINVPYSFRNSRADLTASYNLGRGSVEAGFRSEIFR